MGKIVYLVPRLLIQFVFALFAAMPLATAVYIILLLRPKIEGQ